MRGTENIVRMRVAGRKPTMVNVILFPTQAWARQLTDKASKFVDIHIDEKDIPAIELADLRCLHGVNVSVQGPNSDATERVAKACFNAGASTVQALFFVVRGEEPHIIKGMRFSDSGVVTVWQP